MQAARTAGSSGDSGFRDRGRGVVGGLWFLRVA